MTARLLVLAGCRPTAVVGGDDGPEPPPDDRPPVIRRSAPHWHPPAGPHEWPDVPALVGALDVDEAVAVVTTRDWFATAASQVDRGHVPDLGRAYANLRRAYRQIFGGIVASGIPFVVSAYEAFVARRDHRRLLLRSLGLPDGVDLDVFDGNDARYAGSRCGPDAAWAGEPREAGSPPGGGGKLRV